MKTLRACFILTWAFLTRHCGWAGCILLDLLDKENAGSPQGRFRSRIDSLDLTFIKYHQGKVQIKYPESFSIIVVFSIWSTHTHTSGWGADMF